MYESDFKMTQKDCDRDNFRDANLEMAHLFHPVKMDHFEVRGFHVI